MTPSLMILIKWVLTSFHFFRKVGINYALSEVIYVDGAMKILTVLIVVFCLSGVVVSSLALGAYYDTHPLPCSINDVWDCGIVNRSPYAELHGIPIAMIGIVGYALLAALAGRLPRVTAACALIGMIFALRLTWIEWKVLGVWCIYCVSSQGIITAVFLSALIAAFLSLAQKPTPSSDQKLEDNASKHEVKN